MKKIILVMFLGAVSVFSTFSQSFLPQVYKSPVTGFQLLREEYPLILSQVPAGNSSGWGHSQAFTWVPSEVPGYNKEVRTSDYQANGTWKNSYSVSDSFLLDIKNRIAIAYEDMRYDYPGFSYRYKTKVSFGYDASNRPVRITMSQAQPASSNNYVLSYEAYLYYNSAGKRIRDSIWYASENEAYLAYYHYAPNGNIAEYGYTIPATGDTTNKTFISYTAANKISAEYAVYFDTVSASWLPQYADSFFYNTNNLITGDVSYGMVSMNGGDPIFRPTNKGTFHYTTAGKIDEITEMYWNDSSSSWLNSSKYTIFYTGNTASQGFGYDPEGTGWSAAPARRLLFSWPTGLNDIARTVDRISVYPNPATERVFISSANDAENATVTLTDMGGKNIVLQTMRHDDLTLSADLSSLPNGVYFMDLNTDGNTSRKKLVIAR